VRRDDGDADSFFGQQNSIYLLLVAMEITELRAHQEKSRMAALQAMLAEEGRITALRETLAAAAFQLEGPVNVMNTVLATLERRGNGNGLPAADALADALRAAQAAVDTLRSAIPSQSEEQPTTVNLNEALHDVLSLATGRMLASGIRVGWRPQAVLPAIHGYPNRLRAMFKALIDNAVDAMNVKGWRERELFITSRSLPGALEIVIEDSGPGVPAGARLKVFEPFYTTKKNGGHLGTGLSSALQVAQDHGGGIEIDPADGGGCRVRIVLPLKMS
jgi:nitrogen fixation negative regulator NifL